MELEGEGKELELEAGKELEEGAGKELDEGAWKEFEEGRDEKVFADGLEMDCGRLEDEVGRKGLNLFTKLINP